MDPSSHRPDPSGDRSGPQQEAGSAVGAVSGPVPDGKPGDAVRQAGAGASDAAADAEQDEVVDWRSLPEPVRDRLAELAAEALGTLPAADVPRQLRPVARFAPAKRASSGASALLTGLRESARFRTAVVEWTRTHRPDALDPAAGFDTDPVGAAAAALLLGQPDAATRVRDVAQRTEDASLRSERDAALARVRKLETELAEAREELESARADVERARSERTDQLDKLRGRLRRQGQELREARDAAEQARRDAEQATGTRGGEAQRLADELVRERERADAERIRAERAVADAEAARRSAHEARAADEVRLRLLLDTLGGAADGLRRELALGETGTGAAPADTVGGVVGPASAAERVADADALGKLLRLPAVHLVVDGYNVTKTGYPDLPLVEQRSRLVGQLGALQARVGAEVTVVFDGAGVTSVPAANPRGVRVLFSDPGVLADDVIRDLVAAEPHGRPVIVATSDQEIVTAVRRSGAHAVPSDVLLARLGRT
ncbi:MULTISPECIES: NYN domain-containing protein [Prauserella salsuginis group]|uniref:NYN domain-containing protein n=2 Tax=Prauserella salsuginis group TaxID=2893672 RepID=A0ABW6GB35_9PSEU|nr:MULTISPECIES: NYN domain-containing protein [Prauserella salsuginis group]MBB3661191.1 putative RNA-binding protein with PIN domain [Prauserella sediminis]MCR3719052.1 putative RNA-binding protein containing a PIN domain [Prauserella flava]MCR3733622.1 putative RNA-binding protein containing a PIN domain [Prauserella salsuginis]